MPTVAQTVAEVAAQFAEASLVFGHGTSNAWDEAVALVLGVTGWPDDVASNNRNVTAADAACIEGLAQRRIRERIPLPYLLGRVRCGGMEFLCEPGIVIPRSPIAALIVDGLRPWLRRPPRLIADVCTGSGCLGILAAQVFASARAILLDIEPRAIALARRNIELHGLADRVDVGLSDLFSGWAGSQPDLVICNPPYVDAADMAALPAEHAHEPALGLAGGDDGLEIVTRLMEQAAQRLAPDGLLVCEVGASAAALQRRFPRLPFVWPDLPAGGAGVFVLEGEALADAFGHQG